jgi:hypothetical protein
MDVAIHEARGHHRLAIGEHLGSRTESGSDLKAIPYCSDRVSGQGYGLSPGSCGITGPDPAEDDEINSSGGLAGERMGESREEKTTGENGAVEHAASTKLGESSDRLQLLQRAAATGSRGNREEISDIEQDLQHQLVPHVCALEVNHASLIAGFSSPVEGLAVDRFEIGEDPVTRAHVSSAGVGSSIPPVKLPSGSRVSFALVEREYT